MHTPSLKIEEDIEFLKVITANQMHESLKTKQLAKLRLLPQIHGDSNLEKEYSHVIYKPCTTLWVAHTIQLPRFEEI
jgi:hypothetical protein